MANKILNLTFGNDPTPTGLFTLYQPASPVAPASQPALPSNAWYIDDGSTQWLNSPPQPSNLVNTSSNNKNPFPLFKHWVGVGGIPPMPDRQRAFKFQQFDDIFLRVAPLDSSLIVGYESFHVGLGRSNDGVSVASPFVLSAGTGPLCSFTVTADQFSQGGIFSDDQSFVLYLGKPIMKGVFEFVVNLRATVNGTEYTWGHDPEMVVTG